MRHLTRFRRSSSSVRSTNPSHFTRRECRAGFYQRPGHGGDPRCGLVSHLHHRHLHLAPNFFVIAIVTAVLVGILTILIGRSTAGPLKEASKADALATQRASTAFQNTETIHSMGMRAPMRAKWLEAHEAALGWSVTADDRSTVLRILSSFVRASLTS